ncbi:M48 family metallopeptidase [Polycladidibacter hongkongensis]|uniref:M48 family metallopeptidase n=1 Tax=Polycladidibacter hongkongensis TaxID=1647556 RepID=UPI00083302E9|nr:SprT family zinc-dependent metalloprotease [Pseudovibrio hongkongensis]
MRFFPIKPLPDHIHVQISNETLRINLRRNEKARKYVLRLPASGVPVLTVPARGTLKTAQKFADRQASWLAARLAGRPEKILLLAGDIVPLRGVPHQIVPSGKLRGLVEAQELEDGSCQLIVPGEPSAIARKSKSFLQEQARQDLTIAVEKHAMTLGKSPVKRISIRDTRTRWGSCSSTGTLSFSWRLIMAPPRILDYVAAHEVAHLVHMDHSAEFWQLCETLAPQTKEARSWLRKFGNNLHVYGETP